MSKDMDLGMNRPNEAAFSRRYFLKGVGALAVGLFLPKFLPNSIGPNPASLQAAEAAPVLGPEQQQAQSVEYTWQRTSVTKESLNQEQNRQGISAVGCVKNAQRELTGQLIVKPRFERATNRGTNTYINRLYTTRYDSSTRQMEEFSYISDIPVGWTTRISAFEDGTTIVAGGETERGSGDTAVAISFDQGNRWKQIPWNHGAQGVVRDIVRLPGSNKVILGTAQSHASNRTIFIGDIDRATETVQITPTDIFSVPADISIASYDEKSNKVMLYGAGTEAQQRGLLVYEIDLNTNKGTVRNVLEHLGILEAKGEFTDDSGNTFITAVNNDPAKQEIYLIDGKSLTVSSTISFKGLFDGRGITRYSPDSALIGATEVVKTKTGERKLVLAGTYSQIAEPGKQSSNRPIVASFILGKNPKDTLMVNDFAGDINVHSGMQARAQVHSVKTPDQNPILVGYAYGLTMVVYDIEQNKVFFTNKGLNNTSRPGPNSTPRTYWEQSGNKYGAAIPAVGK